MGFCLLQDQATPSFIQKHSLKIFLFPIFAFGCKYISLYIIITIMMMMMMIIIIIIIIKQYICCDEGL